MVLMLYTNITGFLIFHHVSSKSKPSYLNLRNFVKCLTTGCAWMKYVYVSLVVWKVQNSSQPLTNSPHPTYLICIYFIQALGRVGGSWRGCKYKGVHEERSEEGYVVDKGHYANNHSEWCRALVQ